MPPGAGVTVVLNALDEERHLPFALRSVAPWAAEIVVVDMASTDGSAAVARGFGARVVPHPRLASVEAARGFAVAHATREWVLVLDPDELVPPGLARRLVEIAHGDGFDVVRIPRVNYLLGAPLLHTGWNPERERHVRFFRPSAVAMPTRLHEPIRPVAGARVLELPYVAGEALVHFNYTDVDQFIARLARYTSVEADDAYARGEPTSPWRTLRDAGYEWAARYLWHGGWRDGWRGFHLALLMAFYRVTVHAKLAARRRLGTGADVDRAYAREAERLLGESSPVQPDAIASTKHSTSPKCS